MIVEQDFGGDRNSVTVLGHIIMTIIVVLIPMLIMMIKLIVLQDFGGDRNSVTVLS